MDMNGKLKILTSMAIFGTVGIFVRFIPLPSAVIAFCRGVLGCLFLLAFMMLTKKKLSLPDIKQNLWRLVISGAAIGINWILLFEAYRYTTISSATLAYYFAPVLVTLLSCFLFKEKLGVKQWLCFAASTLGVLLITGIGGEGSSTVGVLLGLGAACLYATVVLINKYIGEIDGILRTLLQFCAAAVVMLPYVALSGGFHLHELRIDGVSLLLCVGLIHTGLAYCLYFSSLKDMKGQEVAVMSYIDPLVAVIASVAILREPISPFEIVGGLLILGAALINEINFKKK
jgi:drug/metabolite transporter (DMT)-like permease